MRILAATTPPITVSVLVARPARAQVAVTRARPDLMLRGIVNVQVATALCAVTAGRALFRGAPPQQAGGRAPGVMGGRKGARKGQGRPPRGAWTGRKGRPRGGELRRGRAVTTAARPTVRACWHRR